MLTWGATVEVTAITSTRHGRDGLGAQADGVKPVRVDRLSCPERDQAGQRGGGRAKNKILKVDFVGVQQGDDAVIETPTGKVMLIDGGDNQMFARYLASRFRRTTAKRPKEIDCILVSHGDADHFAGLTEPQLGNEQPNSSSCSSIRAASITTDRQAARPLGNRTLKVTEQLGKTVAARKDLIITGLEENLLDVPDEPNKPFLEWKNAAGISQARRSPFDGSKGDDKAFDFLSETA